MKNIQDYFLKTRAKIYANQNAKWRRTREGETIYREVVENLGVSKKTDPFYKGESVKERLTLNKVELVTLFQN